jgi:hypothetical protein
VRRIGEFRVRVRVRVGVRVGVRDTVRMRVRVRVGVRVRVRVRVKGYHMLNFKSNPYRNLNSSHSPKKKYNNDDDSDSDNDRNSHNGYTDDFDDHGVKDPRNNLNFDLLDDVDESHRVTLPVEACQRLENPHNIRYELELGLELELV